jgi:hypothetical protein
MVGWLAKSCNGLRSLVDVMSRLADRCLGVGVVLCQLFGLLALDFLESLVPLVLLCQGY